VGSKNFGSCSVVDCRLDEELIWMTRVHPGWIVSFCPSLCVSCCHIRCRLPFRAFSPRFPPPLKPVLLQWFTSGVPQN